MISKYYIQQKEITFLVNRFSNLKNLKVAVVLQIMADICTGSYRLGSTSFESSSCHYESSESRLSLWSIRHKFQDHCVFLWCQAEVGRNLWSTQGSLGVFLDRSTDLQVVLGTACAGLDVELVEHQVELSTLGSDDPLALLVIWVFAGVVGGLDENCAVTAHLLWVKGYF